MKGFPFSLLAALSAQVLCQLAKVVYFSFKERRTAFKYFLSPGGMPSSHSAFVTALCVSTGIRSGFFSDLFAVSLTFSAIVIYDALRLRGTVQKQSIMINRFIEKDAGFKGERMSEMVGHTLPEIIAGIMAGIIVAVGMLSLSA